MHKIQLDVGKIGDFSSTGCLVQGVPKRTSTNSAQNLWLLVALKVIMPAYLLMGKQALVRLTPWEAATTESKEETK